jgi:hypothetical protein
MGGDPSLKNKGRKMKAVVAMLVFTLLWTQAAYGAVTETTANGSAQLRMQFPDVSNSHWALKHITKLALEGIIQGDDKGNFNPDNTVSQQDVIIMAVRAAGFEAEAMQKGAVVLPVDADNYAKQYIAEALDKGLLKIGEETYTSPSTASWGTRSATREWVAKIVIRSLGKQTVADQLANTVSVFKDNADITASMLGYINAAANLHIVDGFDDGTFKPQGLVTRAQMAAFLSRSDKYLTTLQPGVTEGYVSQFSDKNLILVSPQGQSYTYTLSANVVFYTVKDDTARIPSTYIQPKMKVSVIHDSNNVVYYVEDMNESQTEPVKVAGVLDQIDINQLTVSVTTDKGSQTYRLSPSVSVVDQDGKGSSLSVLVKGAQLEMTVQGDTVIQLALKFVAVDKTGEAVLISIDTTGMSLTWAEKATNKTESFGFPAQLAVEYNGTTIGINQLHPGDTVQYSVVNSKVAGLTVTNAVIAPAGTADNGKLESMDITKKIMTITNADGKLVAYRINDNATVTIEGIPSSTLNDVVVGDSLKLGLANGGVQNISVLNRAVRATLMSTIVNYNNDVKVLTVQGADGSVHAYKLTPSTSIVYDGTTVTMDNFMNFFGSGKKIDYTASDTSLLSVKLASRYDGIIQQVNPATNEITLKLPDNNIVTFKLASAASVVAADSTGNSLVALKPGDDVRLTLTGNQDLAASVAVRKTIVYRVGMIDLQNQQFLLKTPTGAATTFSVPSSAIVESSAQTGLTLGNIAADSTLDVTFTGNTIDKIRILDIVRGKVTALDPAKGTLTLQTYQNNTQTFTVGTDAVYSQNSRLLAGLNALKTDDRVELVKDLAGKYYIAVAVADQRTVSSYNAYNKQIVLKRVNIDDQTNYDFMDNAYIHQGTQTINPNFLYDPNEVRIYMIDGKIMELEKLN